MSSAKIIILEYICPGLGVVMANVMFASPYKDLKRALDSGNKADLNPTPWAFMLGNCLGWVTYSILLQNLWIFFGNCPGFVMSVWYNLGAAKLMHQEHHEVRMRKSVVSLLKEQESSTLTSTGATPRSTIVADDGEGEDTDVEKVDIGRSEPPAASKWTNLVLDATSQKVPAPAPHENLVMIITLTWVICISVICLVPSITQKSRELIVASLVNANLTFFYAAPLSTIYTVLREKDSSSIHVPTMLTNTLNGLFWTAYGIAVFNLFIAIPNGLGAFFGGVQIFLCVIFPRGRSELL